MYSLSTSGYGNRRGSKEEMCRIAQKRNEGRLSNWTAHLTRHRTLPTAGAMQPQQPLVTTALLARNSPNESYSGL
ncbi:hypothetical protein MIND_00179400 [Mycena indigotica]|uniref:Uncharacterized protein n=1 Tax=Mycena indigotica TaxID=2126181 RepID=A0A8H6T7M4_9AGAR|nr:uncharacterized protein MIND_00179400 [Mycena indigotica]KAF7311696.1 hypothetical protein MIND_00179400 [Mycena indigotica]